MTRARTSVCPIAAALAVVTILFVPGISPAFAVADPPHKTKHSTPAKTVHAAPDVTSTIARPSGVKPEAQVSPETTPQAEDVSIPPPFLLPAASRAQVRACGAQWRDMKMAGTTGDDDWRDFAMRCFVEDASKTR